MGEQSTQTRQEPPADPVLDGSKLRIHVGDHSYEGWGRVRGRDGRLVLYDAHRDDGERFDTVLVDDFIAVEQLGDSQTVRTLAPTALEPSPYDVRDVELSDIDLTAVPPDRHRQLYRHQRLLSYPVAACRADSAHELIAGHRRVAAAAQAELGEIAVKLVDVDEWTATQMFVHEHFPYPHEPHDDPELYDTEEMHRSLERLRDRWDDERLRTLLPLRPLLDELVTEQCH
jgi:hypothetical protein